MKIVYFNNNHYLISYPVQHVDYAIMKLNNDELYCVLPQQFYKEINPESKIQQDIIALYPYTPLQSYIYAIPSNTINAENIDICRSGAIKNICDAIKMLHDNGYYHGDLFTNRILIEPDLNIRFTHCVNSGKLFENFKEIKKRKVNHHIQTNKVITSNLLTFLDYYIFARSLQDTAHIDVHTMIDTGNDSYNKFLAMTFVLHSTVFGDMNCLLFNAKFDYLASIVMQVPFTGNLIIDTIIHDWNLMFHTIQKHNNKTNMWLSNTIYTDFEYMYKKYDRIYRGEDLRVNEYIKVEHMQNKCNSFDLYLDISDNNYRLTYDISYYKLKRWKNDEERVLNVINVIKELRTHNFFHGNLTSDNILSHITTKDVQLINCEYSKLLDISNCVTKNDITLKLIEDDNLSKDFLFFYDVFTFVLSIYNKELNVNTNFDDFNESWTLISKMSDYERQCFDLNVKNVVQIRLDK